MVEAVTKGPFWLFKIPKPRALLVVAHPDDETIFAGGVILCSRETQWTIVCCTTGSDQRQDEFLRACQFLAKESRNRINPILLRLVPNSHIDRLALAKELRSHATGYDIVFTHNSQGEYGHPDHKLVHRYVIDSIANPNTWVFISLGQRTLIKKNSKARNPEEISRSTFHLRFEG